MDLESEFNHQSRTERDLTIYKVVSLSEQMKGSSAENDKLNHKSDQEQYTRIRVEKI